jgi:response regulator of citrate/malate metabolism
MNFLIIEDNKSLAQSLGELFNTLLNAECDICYTCKDGIKNIHDKQYDIIWADYYLVDGTSEKLINELQDHSHLPHLVFISGADIEKKSFRYQNLNFLAKPINPQEAMDLAKKLLNI